MGVFHNYFKIGGVVSYIGRGDVVRFSDPERHQSTLNKNCLNYLERESESRPVVVHL